MIQKGQQKAVDQWLRGQLYICNKKVYGLEIHDTFVEFYLSIFKQYQILTRNYFVNFGYDMKIVKIMIIHTFV